MSVLSKVRKVKSYLVAVTWDLHAAMNLKVSNPIASCEFFFLIETHKI